MPLKWFLGPNGERVEFAGAPAWFEERGIMPAAAVQLLVEDRGRSAHLSPSMLDPDTTCRREAIIERLFDYGIDPRDKWTMEEGTTWHDAFAARVKGEVEIPNDGDKEHAKVSKCVDGKLRVEVYPGVLMRGYVDGLNLEGEEIQDYKTLKYPKTYGGKNAKAPVDYREKDKSKYEPQLNAYADMVEALGWGKIKKLSVWTMYRGSHDKLRTWLKLSVRRLPGGGLWPKIAQWATQFQGWLDASTSVSTDEGKKILLATIPLDGLDKQMFNGTKCATYCPVREICMKHDDRWEPF